MVYWTEQLSHAVVGLCGRLFVKYFSNRFPFAEPLRCHSSLICMRKVSFRIAKGQLSQCELYDTEYQSIIIFCKYSLNVKFFPCPFEMYALRNARRLVTDCNHKIN